jgi:hypothetical protein
MTLGELKAAIKNLEIDNPKLNDNSDVLAYNHSLGCDMDLTKAEVSFNGNLIFTVQE